MIINNSRRWSPPGPWPVALSLCGCGVAFLARLALHGMLGEQLPMFFFVLNCLAVAFLLGFWPAMVALVASIPVAGYSFVQPVFTFEQIGRQDVIAATGAFMVTALAAGLIEWLRRALYRAELHARVSDSRYRMLVDSDLDRRQALSGQRSAVPGSLGEESSRAVVLLHGLCGSAAELGSLPRMFERAGFTVSVLHIPGYAAATGATLRASRWEEWCDAVHAEISRLRQDHRTVCLCGLSMGATLALASAARGASVEAVVALSPVLRYDGWSIPWHSPLLAIPYALGFRSWAYREREPYGLKNVEMRRRVTRSLESGAEVTDIGAQDIPARHLRQANRLMAFVRGALPAVRADVAVIHAVDDETAAPRNAELIARSVGSEHRKVLWLGDSYHIVTLDNEREMVANEVVRFVSRAAGAHAHDQDRRRGTGMAVLRDRRERPARLRA